MRARRHWIAGITPDIQRVANLRGTFRPLRRKTQPLPQQAKKWQRIPGKIVESRRDELRADGTNKFVQCKNRQSTGDPIEWQWPGHFSRAVVMLFRAGTHGFP